MIEMEMAVGSMCPTRQEAQTALDAAVAARAALGPEFAVVSSRIRPMRVRGAHTSGTFYQAYITANV